MNVLIDTSVWVAHFRQANSTLADLLELDRVLIHPLVLGELACGTPPAPRERTLSALALLGQAHPGSTAEVMEFIEREKLYGLGCGFIDIALLASTCITPQALLWTQDKKLMSLANRFGVEFTQAVH
jgi:predicted nucleic acid-binding protein